MTTPLSERLAAAFIALKIATNRTDDPALLAAARAYSRIADEVDGVGAVEHRAANLEHLDIIGSRNMEIERLSASLTTAERERDDATAERDRYINEEAKDLAEQGKELDTLRVRLAELTKPGPATNDGLWEAWYADPPTENHITWDKARRAVYNLGRAHGRAERADRVAELEKDRESMSRSHRVDTADFVRVAVSEWKERARNVEDRHANADASWRERDRAWQAATGAATPAGVRRLTEAMLAESWTVNGINATFRALTAAGPVVLTGATPSDEEIARGLHDLIFPGAKYHAIDAETWTAAVAKVVRPLLARPAQTSAGGDAGREADRLRDAVVEAALTWWREDREASAWGHMNGPLRALSAHLAAQARAQVAQPAPFDFASFLDARHEWAVATFGPGTRTAGVLDHIRKELSEIESTPTDASEWVDLIFLATDGAIRNATGSSAGLIAAMLAKDAKNRARTWPDWRTAPPDKAIEHDRSGEPAPVDPAKGARFVVVRADEVNGRPANWWREIGDSTGGAAKYAADCNGGRMFRADARQPDQEYAVVDTAQPVAPPAPSDVERLAAAIRSAKFPTLPTDAIGSTYLAEAILRHLAGPLPGVDRAEELIAAYVDAFAETSGTICDRWSEVDRKRKAHAIATMRRAMLAVGAQEPARVPVGAVTWTDGSGWSNAVMGRLTLSAASNRGPSGGFRWTCHNLPKGAVYEGDVKPDLASAKAAAVDFALSLNGATITGGGK